MYYLNWDYLETKGHHGGHVEEGIGGVDDNEDSIGPDRVLDSVHQKNKGTLQ